MNSVQHVQRKELLLDAFLGGRIEGKNFPHVDHVCVAFELLQCRSFPDALVAYSTSLKEIATRVGNPAAYHETVTVAFLALIAERCVNAGYADFDAFILDDHELLDKSILERWYGKAHLLSDIARKTFILPAAHRPCTSA